MGLGLGFLTFLMFLCFLGGGKGGSLSKQVSNRRNSNSPHEIAKMISITKEGLELCHVARMLFREKRGFSII